MEYIKIFYLVEYQYKKHWYSKSLSIKYPVKSKMKNPNIDFKMALSHYTKLLERYPLIKFRIVELLTIKRELHQNLKESING